MFNMKHNMKKDHQQKFDIESDMEDLSKARVYQKNLEDQVNKLKALLRVGSSRDTFDKLQALLDGYLAAQKVLTRVINKMN